MTVRILAGLAGEPFVSGEVLDLPTDRADQMVREGRAELIAIANTVPTSPPPADAFAVDAARPRARRRPPVKG